MQNQKKGDFKVSIVIPNYNGEVLLKKSLQRIIQAQKNPSNKILEIIVVDDASKDKSVNILKEEFPSIKIIKHKVNRGFSAAVNTGVRMSKGNLVVLLNTDVAVEHNFLENALEHFENEKVFAVSLHEAGFGWAKGLFKDGFIVHGPGKEESSPHLSFWVSGGSGIFRRKYWIELGGMDERLFSPFYWEDIDICYRAYKRGYINLWEPNSRVIHEHESTTQKLPASYVTKIQEKNQLLFIWKNLTSSILFRKHLRGLFERVIKSPGYLLIVFMAAPRLPIVLKERRKEIKESVVSDEAIFAKFND